MTWLDTQFNALQLSYGAHGGEVVFSFVCYIQSRNRENNKKLCVKSYSPPTYMGPYLAVWQLLMRVTRTHLPYNMYETKSSGSSVYTNETAAIVRVQLALHFQSVCSDIRLAQQKHIRAHHLN